MKTVQLYSEFEDRPGYLQMMRGHVRNSVVWTLSQFRTINSSTNWIRFPYYHHVFDDEKSDFERQLKYLKNYGDFISMDEACDLLKNAERINGKYFCLSFDDGFENCATNMVDVTSGLSIPVIIYIPTKFVGFRPQKDNIEELNAFNLPNLPAVSFLSWEQCRDLLSQEVDFGSHTVSHTGLKHLTSAQLELELEESKQLIESNLGIVCKHFACPWGRPGIDFDDQTIKDTMLEFGYDSFSTTVRGKMDGNNSNRFAIKRDHFLANWGNYQLRYFLSL